VGLWGDTIRCSHRIFGRGRNQSCCLTPMVPHQRRADQISLGSPGRIRTSDPTVNSRLLYRLSYRGALLLLGHRGLIALQVPQ
jgi:hypothetical protein